jgi:prepilin-type N-terminal cleavage/methylation domain-containing protein
MTKKYTCKQRGAKGPSLTQTILKSHSGFSLIEILTALFVISMVLLLVPWSNESGFRNNLEATINDLERTVRFATNEAILKNSIVRLRINLEKEPPEYIVEFSTTPDFVLPKQEDESKMSLKELKAYQEKQKNISNQFQLVPEFVDTKREIPDSVTILGLATNDRPVIRTEGQLSLYFYPSGEKDSGILFLATDDEIASLDVLPFQDRTNVQYKRIPEEYTEDLFDVQLNLAKEVLDEWIKN